MGSWRKGRKGEKSEIKGENKVGEGRKGEKSEIKVENKVGEGRRERRVRSKVEKEGGENWKMGKRTKELCRVGEHQHRLAHQCSPCEKIVQDLK